MIFKYLEGGQGNQSSLAAMDFVLKMSFQGTFCAKILKRDCRIVLSQPDTTTKDSIRRKITGPFHPGLDCKQH